MEYRRSYLYFLLNFEVFLLSVYVLIRKTSRVIGNRKRYRNSLLSRIRVRVSYTLSSIIRPQNVTSGWTRFTFMKNLDIFVVGFVYTSSIYFSVRKICKSRVAFVTTFLNFYFLIFLSGIRVNFVLQLNQLTTSTAYC